MNFLKNKLFDSIQQPRPASGRGVCPGARWPRDYKLEHSTRKTAGQTRLQQPSKKCGRRSAPFRGQDHTIEILRIGSRIVSDTMTTLDKPSASGSAGPPDRSELFRTGLKGPRLRHDEGQSRRRHRLRERPVRTSGLHAVGRSVTNSTPNWSSPMSVHVNFKNSQSARPATRARRPSSPACRSAPWKTSRASSCVRPKAWSSRSSPRAGASPGGPPRLGNLLRARQGQWWTLPTTTVVRHQPGAGHERHRQLPALIRAFNSLPAHDIIDQQGRLG